MMISRTYRGKFVNWAGIIAYFQLVEELIRWENNQKNLIKGIAKRKPKKDICHFTIVL
jgi:hypothetical protein